MSARLASGVYEGWVRHRRFTPVAHAFRYRLFMMYIDLAELPGLFDDVPGWSHDRPALAWFRRADYFGDPSRPLDVEIRDLVEREAGTRPTGPIRLLTHLRYFGYCFNPISVYYCFDRSGRAVETIVLEVTNTPWAERHAYVLPITETPGAGGRMRVSFDKRLHVSPFLDMRGGYAAVFTPPDQRLVVHIDSVAEGARRFDATLVLERRELDRARLTRVLARYPAMTARVWLGIHWQALRLWLARAPFHPHPGSDP